MSCEILEVGQRVLFRGEVGTIRSLAEGLIEIDLERKLYSLLFNLSQYSSEIRFLDRRSHPCLMGRERQKIVFLHRAQKETTEKRSHILGKENRNGEQKSS